MTRILHATYLIPTLLMTLAIFLLARRQYPLMRIEMAVFEVAIVLFTVCRFCIYPLRQDSLFNRAWWMALRLQTISCIGLVLYLAPLRVERM